MKDKNLLLQNGVDLDKSLELFGDMDMYNESLGDFMAEVENKLYKISHFKEMKDMPNYAILVHSLKSDARYFGFTLLGEMAYEHEIKSKENNFSYVNEHYNSLMNEANKIVDLVRRYLNSDTNDQTERLELDSYAPLRDTILVADDSEIITKFLIKIFEKEYDVLVANDGEIAMNHLRENNNIKAFLLDLSMPRVDGFKVLEFMKENNLFDKIPVSIVTGNDDKNIKLNAFEYPIVDILKKPFSPESAKTILNRTIESKSRY